MFLAKVFRTLELPILTARFHETGLTFVDIGGRRSVVRELRMLAPFAHYVTCEPDTDEAAHLAADNRDGWKRFTVVPSAIAPVSGTASLYQTRKPGMSSLLVPDSMVVRQFARAGRFEVVGCTQVPTIPLDGAAVRYGFTDACFLKLDTQGTELDILRSGETLLSSVRGVEVEASFRAFYRGQPLFADVDAFLREHGFELFLLNRTNIRHMTARPDLVSRRVTVYADALYFRVDPPDAVQRIRLLGLLLAFAYFDLALTVAEGNEQAEVERIAVFASEQVTEPGRANKAFRDEDLDL
jgi:FkbM family methyltransferase